MGLKMKLNSHKSNSKETDNLLAQLKKELNSNEINNILERYKNTYSYIFMN